MKYLIDTHVCLWAIANKEKLSLKVRDILEDFKTQILLSQVSLMEITIKLQLGKLKDFEVSLPEFIDAVTNTGFEILPLKNEHFLTYLKFDFPERHRDPFDRFLIATSLFEGASLISKDEKFKMYANKLKIIW